MLSKQLATIDCNVPVELDVSAMKAGAPDIDTLRDLFTELEFTSLLKELLPVVEVTDSHYFEARSAADVESLLKAVAHGGTLAVALQGTTEAAAKKRWKSRKTKDRQPCCR